MILNISIKKTQQIFYDLIVIKRREKAHEVKGEAHGLEMDEFTAYFRGKNNVSLL